MNYHGHFDLIHFNIAVDYLLILTFFMCKMYLSFLIDVYVIFLYQNICINCTHIHIWVLFEIFLMLVLFFGLDQLFSVNNVLTLRAFGCSSFM